MDRGDFGDIRDGVGGALLGVASVAAVAPVHGRTEPLGGSSRWDDEPSTEGLQSLIERQASE